MAIGESSRFQFRYIKEVTWGTTPASAMTNMRVTSANLKQVNETVVSEELRSDGQITDLIRVGVSATASISGEMSYNTLNDFLAAALSGAWAADTGFGGAESGTDLLANGTTAQSFTIEGEYSNITQFISITGARVNSLTITQTLGQVVRFTMEFVGKVAAIGSATVGTGAATAATTTDVFSPVDLSGIEEGGASAELRSIELSINRNARAQQVLGTVGLKGVGLGRIAVTGSLEAYFENASLMSDYFAHNASSLDWILSDAAGNELAFKIDRLKWVDGEAPADGNDADVMQRFPFQALMDPTSGKTLRIAKTDAA